METEESKDKNNLLSPDSCKESQPSTDHGKENQDIEQSADQKDHTALLLKGNTSEEKNLENLKEETIIIQGEEQSESLCVVKSLDIMCEKSNENKSENRSGDLTDSGETDTNMDMEEVSHEEEYEPIFDGIENPEMEANSSFSQRSIDSDGQGSVWPEKAVALSNFVRQKSLFAVSTVMRRLSGRSDDGQDASDEDKSCSKEIESQQFSEKSIWNPLSLIGGNKSERDYSMEDIVQPIPMKGRIVLYTRLGCQDCKEARKFLHGKRLRYVEINIDIYNAREQELERLSGSCAVPKVFFNEVLIGGLSEIKILEESGKLGDKIDYVVSEIPSYEAPQPPLSGEDDPSSGGDIDELALIARKMKASISVKDRFYKMRRFTNCFLGSEAVDFLSEDQYLEREEAVEFGRKLANKLFFLHVDNNAFEDGNTIYRFLEDDPLVSQCQNIPRGISEVKPKPVAEISSRLRLLSRAIFEAYASEDGKHVDYRSIHGSEEFARYLRIVEELQRVELLEMSREEKLSFFINLYNVMVIHATLVWGHPAGPLDRRKFFGDFKYVIGGSTYSLSAIYNGILRGNQRPPYNPIKPFRANDRRLNVALPHTEPLVHFALVIGTRSGPALRCYSPGDIDKELMDAARTFLRTGGIYVDTVSNTVYVTKLLKWYSSDFGKNEVEVLRHAANYLEVAESQAFLELLSNTQLKVVYLPYDWGLNH